MSFSKILQKSHIKKFRFKKQKKACKHKHLQAFLYGALAEIRTPDTLIKSQVLYRLSYKGIDFVPIYIITQRAVCQ